MYSRWCGRAGVGLVGRPDVGLGRQVDVRDDVVEGGRLGRPDRAGGPDDGQQLGQVAAGQAQQVLPGPFRTPGSGSASRANAPAIAGSTVGAGAVAGVAAAPPSVRQTAATSVGANRSGHADLAAGTAAGKW